MYFERGGVCPFKQLSGIIYIRCISGIAFFEHPKRLTIRTFYYITTIEGVRFVPTIIIVQYLKCFRVGINLA